MVFFALRKLGTLRFPSIPTRLLSLSNASHGLHYSTRMHGRFLRWYGGGVFSFCLFGKKFPNSLEYLVELRFFGFMGQPHDCRVFKRLRS